MKTSQTGLKLIQSFESCRLHSYKDVGGIWTIGWGHVGPEVVEGLRWTQDQADEAQRADLAHAEMAVTCQIVVPLTQNQFDALVSFTFNVGAGNLYDSTLKKRLNAGDYRHAATWFLPWCKVHGKEVEGLMHRRQIEMALFLKPDGQSV